MFKDSFDQFYIEKKTRKCTNLFPFVKIKLRPRAYIKEYDVEMASPCREMAGLISHLLCHAYCKNTSIHMYIFDKYKINKN